MKTSLLLFSSQLHINHPLDSKLLLLCHLVAVIISLFICNLWTSILFISLIITQMHRTTNIRHLRTHQHRASPYINLLYDVDKSRPPGFESHGGNAPVNIKSPLCHHSHCSLATFTATTGKHGSHHTYSSFTSGTRHVYFTGLEVLLVSFSQAHQMP